MGYSTELLDAAKTAQGIASDYRLAKLLGVPGGTVSNYRRGANFPANSIAWRLGELAGIDPATAMIGCNLERTSNPADRALWRELGRRIVSAHHAQPGA